LALLGQTALFVLLSSACALAAGTVSTCAYSGAGGLSDALVGGGAVTFTCSGTIIVPGITITANTSIDGTGQSVTLSGNHANPVFTVSAVDVTLNLVNLTIANGLALTSCSGSPDGGGICNLGGAVNITGCTLSGNASPFGEGDYPAVDSARLIC